MLPESLKKELLCGRSDHQAMLQGFTGANPGEAFSAETPKDSVFQQRRKGARTACGNDDFGSNTKKQKGNFL